MNTRWDNAYQQFARDCTAFPIRVCQVSAHISPGNLRGPASRFHHIVRQYGNTFDLYIAKRRALIIHSQANALIVFDISRFDRVLTCCKHNYLTIQIKPDRRNMGPPTILAHRRKLASVRLCQ